MVRVTVDDVIEGAKRVVSASGGSAGTNASQELLLAAIAAGAWEIAGELRELYQPENA